MNEESSMADKPTKKLNPMLIVAIVLAASLLGWYLMRTLSPTNQRAANTEATVSNPDVTTADTVGDGGANESVDVQVVSVEGGSFYYTPNEITVKKGQVVRVELTSVDMMHDFTIDELGVSMPIVPSGNTGSVEFIADTVGEFEFYCSVGQHRENGQVGRLIVQEVE